MKPSPRQDPKLYWSNSKQQWLRISEMHTAHIVNALRQGLSPAEQGLLSELVTRLEAAKNPKPWPENLTDEQLAEALVDPLAKAGTYSILRQEAAARLRGKS